MKRLLAQIGITFYSVLAVAFYVPETVTVILGGAALVASVIFLLSKKTRRTIYIPAVAVTIMAACLLNIGYTHLYVDPVTDHCVGKDVKVHAVLKEEPYRAYSKYYYRLVTEQVKGESATVKLLLKTPHPLDIELYDKIYLTANISKNDNLYYRSKQYYLTIDSYDMSYQIKAVEDKGPLYLIYQLRRSLSDAIDDLLPEDEAALCKAVFLGDKYAMDLSDRNSFRYCGVSYFIVVSGLHFSILLFVFWGLFLKLFKKRLVAFFCTLPVMLLYIGITGLQTSVVRAGIMAAILLLGRAGFRQTDPLNSLGFAGLLLPIIFSPYGCGDIGLILSFYATLGILLFAAPIYQRISLKESDKLFKRVLNYILSVISVSVAANLFVFPISVIVFRAFSLITLFSTLLLYPLIPAILVLTMVVCLFYYIGFLRYLAIALSWALYLLCRVMLLLVRWMATLPFAYRYADLSLIIWVIVTAALIMCAYLLRRQIRLMIPAVLISLILLIGGLTVNVIVGFNTFDLTVYQTENGCALTYVHNNRPVMLAFTADSSSAYDVLGELSREYRILETAICTNNKELRNYSLYSQDEFAFSHILLYDNISELSDYDDADVFEAETTVLLDEGAVLSLYPEGSCVLRILSLHDKTVAFIPSGYPADSFPEGLTNVDILIAERSRDIPDELNGRTLILCGSRDTAQTVPADKTVYTADGAYTVSLR